MADMVRVDYDKLLGMSDEALGITIDSECYWIPFSVIEEYSGTQFGESEKFVVMPYWMAEKKNLLNYAEEA